MATSSNSGNKASGLAGKLGFKKGTFSGFLAVVLSGQLFYSCLQALRGPFYTQLLQMLHVNNTQFGLMFTITSISSFLTLPGGWIMNRFSVKSILITCLSVRCITILAMIYGNLSVTGLYILAAIWSLIQAVFFPTVLNGVALLSTKENKSIAFSMLEWIRRAL
ncbi:MAG: MFS transporter, partial [Lactobacillus sp.]|nr:MFS transporter [Lactobacillus sp.]